MSPQLPATLHRSTGVHIRPTSSPAEVAASEILHALQQEWVAEELQGELRHKYILHTWIKFSHRDKERHQLAAPLVQDLGGGVHRFTLRTAGGPWNQLRFTLPAQPGERFVGFGERFGGVDQRGRCLEVWTEEGAIGFAEWLSPLLTRLNAKFNPFPKGPTTAYKPMPWLLSSRGYGLYLDTKRPVFIDVAASNEEAVVITIDASELDLYLFTGATPKAIVAAFVRHLGRPKPLPNWSIGPWNDAIGGTAEVEKTAALLRQARIPCSAIWTEDWGGGHWSKGAYLAPGWYDINPVRRDVDRGLYPHLEDMATALHADGFKFLGYYYPFIPVDDPAFAHAAEQNYLLRDEAGGPLVFAFFTGKVGQIDLTNPAAKAWHAEELKRGIALGFDGWMADFGEYTPPHSLTASGEDGLTHHNAFPALWATHHREVWEAARPDGDFVFLSRSAAAGQQAVGSVFWSGDSNTNFERWDGLPSNLAALLSAAWSGLAIWTTDLGGYMSLLTSSRDEETLARWTEFAALLPVMRTHHGTHPHRSVQFDHSPASLAHYCTYARLHTALFPLLRQLLDAAAADGAPICRPLVFEFPNDPQAWDCEDAFLLGPDLLVAPVVSRGAVERQVYLPAGAAWFDLWTGQRSAGGSTVTVAAPLGRIPLFIRDGGYLVLFDRYFDTLVPRHQVANAAVLAFEDGDASVSLLLTPAFAGQGRGHDGAVFALSTATDGAELADAASSCNELLPPELTQSWTLLGCAAGREGRIPLSLPHPGGERWWLSLAAARRSRRWSVYMISEGATVLS